MKYDVWLSKEIVFLRELYFMKSPRRDNFMTKELAFESCCCLPDVVSEGLIVPLCGFSRVLERTAAHKNLDYLFFLKTL